MSILVQASGVFQVAYGLANLGALANKIFLIRLWLGI